MKRLIATVIAIAWAVSAQAQEARCPWQQDDPTDEIGASRTQTPENVLESIRLVRTGEIFRLGHVYDEVTLGTPPFGRVFDVTVAPFSFPDEEDNSQSFYSGGVRASIGQIATQFDALSHAGHDLGYYNCFTHEDLGPDELGRVKKLGVENVKPFFTRAVLLDFVANSDVPKVTANGREIVADSYELTVADIEAVIAAQGVDGPGEGDVALFYTGWDSLFGVDNARHFNSPGIGSEAAFWLAERRIAMLGTDTQHSEAAVGGRSVELIDNPDALGREFGYIFNTAHLILITQNGIHLMEWMRLGELAAALAADSGGETNPYEFLFVFSPLPIKGLAGAPGSTAIAVR